MNEVKDPQSNKVVAWVAEPPGATTLIQQVINRTCEIRLLHCEAWVVTVLSTSNDDEGIFFDVGALIAKCRWSKVWWGFWHFLHFWLDGHHFRKCPPLRQFIQSLLSITIAIMHSWGKLWNFLQVYKECLLILHAMQVSLVLAAYTYNGLHCMH